MIGNQGENFSVGANLMMVLLAAQEGEWDELDRAVRRFQQANMALKYAPKPVVAAPFGMTLGGGCEVALHAARVQASAETYMGLVEVGVGLIPAGGGCKELLLRGGELKTVFETDRLRQGVRPARRNARELGLLRAADGISMNPERLIADAKAAALAMRASYAPGAPRQDIAVAGEAGYALLKMGVFLAHEGGYISEYDTVVGEKLAYVLSGGRLTRRAEGSGAIPAGSGARSVPESVRPGEDAGAHAAHAEDRASRCGTEWPRQTQTSSSTSAASFVRPLLLLLTIR